MLTHGGSVAGVEMSLDAARRSACATLFHRHWAVIGDSFVSQKEAEHHVAHGHHTHAEHHAGEASKHSAAAQ
jgi:hypothetical protein